MISYVKAIRGHVVAVQYDEASYTFQEPVGVAARTTYYTLERVTSVSRDGEVKATEQAHAYLFTDDRGVVLSITATALYRTRTSRGRQYPQYRLRWKRTVLIEGVDHDALWGAWCDHIEACQGVSSGWSRGDLGTIEEAREFVRPFRKQPTNIDDVRSESRQ